MTVDTESVNFAELWDSSAATAEAEAPEGVEVEGETETEAPVAPETETPAETEQEGSPETEAESETEVEPDSPEQEAARKKFFAEAKRLGYTVPDENIREVALQDRVRFRKHMQETRQKARQEYESLSAELEQKRLTVASELKKADELKTAVEAGDHNKVAKLMGFDDWKAVNQAFINRNRSPEAVALARLEEERKAEKAEAEAARAKRAEAEAEARRVELIAAHKSDIASNLTEISKGKYKALASDPGFIQTVYHYQEQSWDGSDTIGIEEAAELAFADAKKVYLNLQKLFNSTGGVNTEKLATGEVGNGKKKPKTISRNMVADTSGNGAKELTQDEWIKAWANKI